MSWVVQADVLRHEHGGCGIRKMYDALRPNVFHVDGSLMFSTSKAYDCNAIILIRG